MGCCSNNFFVDPTDVITSNAPHCLWLITVLFLHFIREELLIILLCVSAKRTWLIELNARRCVWNDHMHCRRQRRTPAPSLSLPPTSRMTADQGSYCWRLTASELHDWSVGMCVLKVKLLYHSQKICLNCQNTGYKGFLSVTAERSLRYAQKPWSIYPRI